MKHSGDMEASIGSVAVVCGDVGIKHTFNILNLAL